MKMPTKLKGYNLTEVAISKIQELQISMGLSNETAVIHYCINFTYKKELGK